MAPPDAWARGPTPRASARSARRCRHRWLRTGAGPPATGQGRAPGARRRPRARPDVRTPHRPAAGGMPGPRAPWPRDTPSRPLRSRVAWLHRTGARPGGGGQGPWRPRSRPARYQQALMGHREMRRGIALGHAERGRKPREVTGGRSEGRRELGDGPNPRVGPAGDGAPDRRPSTTCPTLAHWPTPPPAPRRRRTPR